MASASTTAWLNPEVARNLIRSLTGRPGGGFIAPIGPRMAGAWRLQDQWQWDFASGIHNANWLDRPCTIMDGESAEMTSSGTPVVRAAWIRKADVVADILSSMVSYGHARHRELMTS